MEKECPVCGTRFPSYANVCDQHGVALVALPSNRGPKLLGVAAAIALLALAPMALERYWMSCLGVEINSLQIEGKAKPGSSGDLNRWLAERKLAVKFSVVNHSRLPVVLDGANYKLVVSSVEVASAPALFDRLGPRQRLGMEWKVPLADAAIRNLLLHPPAEGIHLEVRANIRLRFTLFSWTLPYRKTFLLRQTLAL